MISSDEEFVSAVLSDGAGSKPHSQIGAEEICHHVSGLVRASFESLWDQEMGAAQSMILQSIRERLAAVSHDLVLDLDDLAATLLFVAIKDDRYIAGNIGDGIIACQVEEAATVLCTPRRGEFANETFFVTSGDALSVFEIRKGMLGSISGFAMMTDGVASCLYSPRTKLLAPAVSTLWRWLEKQPAKVVDQQMLKAIRDLFQPRTSDDCSLAVLKRISDGAEDSDAPEQRNTRQVLPISRVISLTFDDPEQLEGVQSL